MKLNCGGDGEFGKFIYRRNCIQRRKSAIHTNIFFEKKMLITIDLN